MKRNIRLIMYALCMIMMFGYSKEVHAIDANQQENQLAVTIHAGEGYYFCDEWWDENKTEYTYSSSKVNDKTVYKVHKTLKNYVRRYSQHVDDNFILDWYTDPALTHKFNLTTENLKNNPKIDLYAKWGKCYELDPQLGEVYGLVHNDYRFLSGDKIKVRVKRAEYGYEHSDYDIDYYYDNAWQTLYSVRKDGFVLTGLSKTPDGALVNEVTFSNSDETLYGIWEKGWNLRIDYNGGIYSSESYSSRRVENFTMLNGSKLSSVIGKDYIDDLINNCENGNYVCVGFSKNPNATVAEIDDLLDMTVNADTTVYMVWQDPNNITTNDNKKTDEQKNNQANEKVNNQNNNSEGQKDSKTNNTETNNQDNVKNETPAAVGTVINEKTTGTNAKYKVKSSTNGSASVSYAGVSNKNAKSITIPSTIKDENGVEYAVTEIDAKAVSGNKKVKKVTIPSTVTKINKNAFTNCGKLGKITINANSLNSIGKNAFKGIKSGAKITVICKDKETFNKIVKMMKKAGAKDAKYKWKKG
ncbi:Leucine rich repeat-containing protein [Butyrivibrio sp. ob235]|uniref:leucine-rich repeat protein n=1 Tax=Butyrivibrio sp. ob235 TaxID=1761780 RepID=UPI0008ADD596|nr:leucine-rich repeat domain-containing protein [Butyrivibrio sp. ob235]SEM10560.1 Leucine rich repeat-containing protein [Butyrivibrio sp. ob235]